MKINLGLLNLKVINLSNTNLFGWMMDSGIIC